MGTERTGEPEKSLVICVVQVHFEHTATRPINPNGSYGFGLGRPGSLGQFQHYNRLSAKLKNSLVISKYGSIAPKESNHWPGAEPSTSLAMASIQLNMVLACLSHSRHEP